MPIVLKGVVSKTLIAVQKRVSGSWAEAAAAPRPPDALGGPLPTFPLDWGAGGGRLRTAPPDFRFG